MIVLYISYLLFRICCLSSTYQDGAFTSHSSARSSNQFSDSTRLSPNHSKEDSSDWVWSNVENPQGGFQSNSSAKANDSLIDFAENKTKLSSVKSTPGSSTATKVRTAEEEAWDMLNC